jgi:hypothetical protein
MLLDRYDEPTSPFTPLPLDALDWSASDTAALELDAELLPAFMFLERNRDALKFVGPALLQDAEFVIGVLRHAPVLETLPNFVVESLIRRSDIQFLGRIARFTLTERRDIADALIALEANHEARHLPAVTSALDSYWRSLVEIS